MPLFFSGFAQTTVFCFVLLSILSFSDAQVNVTVSCSAALSNARDLTDSIFEKYYKTSDQRDFDGGLEWQEATALEDIYSLNLALLSDPTSNSSSIHDVIQDTMYRVPFTSQDALNVIESSNDDRLWLVLTYWKYADWLEKLGKDTKDAMSSAQQLYDYVAQPGNWDPTCGGIKWDLNKVYVNSITNVLFILAGAEGFQRTANQTMLDQALKTWNWLSSSGLRDDQGLYNDGLTQDGSCKNSGATRWIYIQGTAVSALGSLYKATGSSNHSYIKEAEITLDAVVHNSTGYSDYVFDGALVEPACEDLGKMNWTCPYFPGDQQLYKGLFMKELQIYLERVNRTESTEKYSDFISQQRKSIMKLWTTTTSSPESPNNQTNSNSDSKNGISQIWAKPNDLASNFLSDVAGLEALMAAVEYGCEESA